MEEILQELQRQKTEFLAQQARYHDIELVDAEIRGVNLVKYKLIQMIHEGKSFQEIATWILH